MSSVCPRFHQYFFLTLFFAFSLSDICIFVLTICRPRSTAKIKTGARKRSSDKFCIIFMTY